MTEKTDMGERKEAEKKKLSRVCGSSSSLSMIVYISRKQSCA